MKTDPAKSAERRARRTERVKENAALAWRGPGEPPPYLSGALAEPPKRFRTALGRSGKAKTRKPKRKKSPSLSKLKKELWKEISLLVRSWSETCLACHANTECAGHVVPANSGGATAFFLPNLIPMCFSCNGAELRHRGEWVYRFKAILGEEVVDALYQFNKESKDQSSPYFWQVKKWWVLEQTERMKRLRGLV